MSENEDASALDQLGSRVRELRTEKRMTLTDLSQRSQVSVGMLSHIERGQTSPSLKTLERLRVALGVPLARFFEAETPQSDELRVVTRAADRRKLPLQKLGLVKELLSPAGRPGLEMLLLVVEPGGGSGDEPWTRQGEKGGLVLQGVFELIVDGRPYSLREGDSFQFDGSLPHSFQNRGADEARVIWVIKSDEAG